MCGIAGKLEFSGALVSDANVKRMCDQIIRRGPDAYGYHCEPHIGLGQRRLSVIDLSDSANPPLSNEDDSIWIVFNGEIYNYRELSSKLAATGHRFRTKSDTEVILHLYEQYGTACVEHLRGMFAFAIWDRRAKRLFAARDRLGKKPFFYARTARSLVFGSSINSILADPAIERSPNFAAIDRYLHYQYVPSPETAFCGIEKLPAAHYLVCDASGSVTVTRYWSPAPKSVSTLSEPDIENEIVRLLRESVRLRLISDVPLGVFLSGGIDSGAVTALMALESAGPVKTFSIGFEDTDFNELPYARLVAEKYGTDHHEFVVQPSATEVLPQLIRDFSEPFADSSAIPTYYVSQLARTHVTVALSGDGGDESFLGYDHYAATAQWATMDAIPYSIRRPLGKALAVALARAPFSDLAAKIERAGVMFGGHLAERYDTRIAMVKDQEKRHCYTRNFRALIGTGSNGHNNAEEHSPSLPTDWDWMSFHDRQHYLPDCLMVKTDVSAMAHSLEVRCPFLDHLFVEFAASIPARLKRNRRGGKAILRNALRNLLPAQILEKRKTGFAVPLRKWFRDDLDQFLREVLLSEVAAKRQLFDTRFLARMIDDQVAGRRDWSNRLWGFLCLELWFQEYFG